MVKSDISAGFATMSLMVVFMIFIAMSMTPFFAGIWVSGSLLTSGIKYTKHECGVKYVSDKIFYGDIFCLGEEE